MKKKDNGLDQFFTPRQTAKQCVNKVNELFPLSSFDVIIEPSAGSGAFVDALPQNVIALDLEPKHHAVMKQDFFDFVFPTGKTAVIGNPPYGRRGSLALKFINKCAKHADIIAFILPRGFMRTAMQNSIDQNLHLIHQEMVEDFELPNGNTYKVKSVFQIWERRDDKRDLIEEPKSHPDFELKHAHISWQTAEQLRELKAEYPWAIGQNTMRVIESTNACKGSVWFIKPKTAEVIEILSKCTFETAFYTTGAPSLSKGDIINGYVASTKD